MTLAPGTRRGFLAGGLALLVAPAIVRAEGLMKVAPTSVILPEHRFDTRVLAVYQPFTDQMVIRIDRKLGELPRPPGVLELTVEQAKKLMGKAANHPFFEEQPALGVQRNLTFVASSAEYTHWAVPVQDLEHAEGYTLGSGGYV